MSNTLTHAYRTLLDTLKAWESELKGIKDAPEAKRIAGEMEKYRNSEYGAKKFLSALKEIRRDSEKISENIREKLGSLD